MQAEITLVESTIENEIAQGATQAQVAQTYALALRSSYRTDWARVNAAIVGRWSVAGLDRVKKLAWSGRAFTANPPSPGARDGEG